MSEYERSIEINAPADLVYEFISNPENMPRFLPHVQEVFATDSDRVQLLGSGFSTEADLHLDPDERTMHWNSTSRDVYRGQLQVASTGSGSKVAVQLVFAPDEVNQVESRHPAGIECGLVQALSEIKHVCESAESKVRAANQDQGYLG